MCADIVGEPSRAVTESHMLRSDRQPLRVSTSVDTIGLLGFFMVIDTGIA